MSRPISEWNRKQKLRALALEVRTASAVLYTAQLEFDCRYYKRRTTLAAKRIIAAGQAMQALLARPVIKPKPKKLIVDVK